MAGILSKTNIDGRNYVITIEKRNENDWNC